MNRELAQSILDGSGITSGEVAQLCHFYLRHTNKRDGGEVESDPLDRRLLGRARFLRDRGEIKSPELMEEAERALAESRAEVDRLNELCNGLHRSLTESQAGFVNHRSRAERLTESARAVCDYDWSDNDDDAVAAVMKLRAALEQEPQE